MHRKEEHREREKIYIQCIRSSTILSLIDFVRVCAIMCVYVIIVHLVAMVFRVTLKTKITRSLVRAMSQVPYLILDIHCIHMYECGNKSLSSKIKNHQSVQDFHKHNKSFDTDE